MRKRAISVLLILVLLILTGCSDNNTDGTEINTDDMGILKRTGNTANDEIRFHGIDWLAEKTEVEKTIDKDFGADTYTTVSRSAGYTDTYRVVYWGLEGEGDPVLWKIGGHDTNHLTLYYYSTDDMETGKLYAATIDFNNPSGLVFDDLYFGLAALYTQSSYEYRPASTEVRYMDQNNNIITLLYGSSDNVPASEYIQLTYSCGDVISNLEKNGEKERKEQQRQPTPEL